MAKIDVKADHAGLRKQVAPEREAAALEDAELGDDQALGSKEKSTD
jgi:hypothetical protein